MSYKFSIKRISDKAGSYFINLVSLESHLAIVSFAKCKGALSSINIHFSLKLLWTCSRTFNNTLHLLMPLSTLKRPIILLPTVLVQNLS